MDSILLIEEYAKDCSQSEFSKNQSLQDAVIRRLEIIGEAVKNLPLAYRAKHPDIPWKQMAGMRDILTHHYFDVDLVLTWKVVKHELPQVKKQISALLKEPE
ncbi:MAG TPA: DUF86 domain-containing protein [Chlamydiales bacterium]|nr:DUF86 domain-containing protein [Chlamydiales bacterium]